MEIIYRADDGTEFRNQTDCLLHERMSNLSHNNQKWKVSFINRNIQI